jgi:hypothetical protein
VVPDKSAVRFVPGASAPVAPVRASAPSGLGLAGNLPLGASQGYDTASRCSGLQGRRENRSKYSMAASTVRSAFCSPQSPCGWAAHFDDGRMHEFRAEDFETPLIYSHDGLVFVFRDGPLDPTALRCIGGRSCRSPEPGQGGQPQFRAVVSATLANEPCASRRHASRFPDRAAARRYALYLPR